MTNEKYIYITKTGKEIACWIKEDFGMVQGGDRLWRKVECKPIGFNNCPSMFLDFAELKPIN